MLWRIFALTLRTQCPNISLSPQDDMTDSLNQSGRVVAVSNSASPLAPGSNPGAAGGGDETGRDRNMTDAETFRLMNRLTAEDRMVLECRYDGGIPKDAVLAMLGNYTDQDEIAELREQAARKFDSVKKWLRRGHSEAATYRMSGNNHAARIISERYCNEARDMLEARAVIIAKMRAIESSMAQE